METILGVIVGFLAFGIIWFFLLKPKNNQASNDELKIKDEELKNELKPHLIIANAENSSNGRGISKRIYNHLLGLGINIFTMGNHVWGNREIKEFIEDSNILRPANYNNLPGNFRPFRNQR